MHCGCLKRYLFVTFFHFLAVNCFHLDCSTAGIRRAFVEKPQVISSIWNNGSVYVLLEKNQERLLRAQVSSSRSTSTAAITTANASPLCLTNSLLSPGQLLQSPLGEKGAADRSHKDTPFSSSATLTPLASRPYSSWPPRYSHPHRIATFNPEEGQLLKYNECSGVQKDLQRLSSWAQPSESA